GIFMGLARVPPGLRSSPHMRGIAYQAETVELKVRRGRAVAQLEPVRGGSGAGVKEILRRHPRDREWATELTALRDLVEVEERT
ncbi:MAG: hypothetical protein ACRD0O_09760, partial [Acidimicrobiia bacterium]